MASPLSLEWLMLEMKPCCSFDAFSFIETNVVVVFLLLLLLLLYQQTFKKGERLFR